LTLTLAPELYESAPFVPPLAYYPGARFADHLGTVLRQYYLHAQWAARFVGATSYGYNLRNLSGDTSSVRRAFGFDDWVGLHTGRRTLPRQTSHVTAWVAYAIITDHPVDVHLRLTVSDGTHTDTADRDDITTQSALPRLDSLGNLNPRAFGGENPFSQRWQTYLDPVTVELANVSQLQPGRCQSRVYGYAQYSGSTRPQAFQPLFVGVYAEMRY